MLFSLDLQSHPVYDLANIQDQEGLHTGKISSLNDDSSEK